MVLIVSPSGIRYGTEYSWLGSTVRKHVQRLEAEILSPYEIKNIDTEHAYLVAAYNNDKALQDVVYME